MTNNYLKIMYSFIIMTSKYICNKCNYSTNNKYDYKRHLSTSKHKYYDENIEKDILTCECGKIYKARDGLWKHKKKCNYKKEEKSDISLLTDLVKTLVEENKEFRDTIVNIKPQSNTTNHITTTTTTTNNITNIKNTFNLQLFLNETCKDAMNIDDFIDSIEISIQDLKHLGKYGYVEGISDLFIKNLEELDVTKRPLHCSDIKRETVYIRDKNLWNKENDQKLRLTRVATDIARLNTIVLQNEYQKLYPRCLFDFKSKEHDEYGKIAYEAFGGLLDIEKANKKLFRNIMKIVAINKNNFV